MPVSPLGIIINYQQFILISIFRGMPRNQPFQLQLTQKQALILNYNLPLYYSVHQPPENERPSFSNDSNKDIEYIAPSFPACQKREIEMPIKNSFQENRLSQRSLEYCDQLLNQLQRSKFSIEFLAPVDYIGLGLKNYTEIIKKPMDLMSVRKKLKHYKSVEQMENDIQLIASNCQLYNQKNPYYIKLATKFINTYKKKKQKLSQKYAYNEPQTQKPQAKDTQQGTMKNQNKKCQQGQPKTRGRNNGIRDFKDTANTYEVNSKQKSSRKQEADSNTESTVVNSHCRVGTVLREPRPSLQQISGMAKRIQSFSRKDQIKVFKAIAMEQQTEIDLKHLSTQRLQALEREVAQIQKERKAKPNMRQIEKQDKQDSETT